MQADTQVDQSDREAYNKARFELARMIRDAPLGTKPPMPPSTGKQPSRVRLWWTDEREALQRLRAKGYRWDERLLQRVLVNVTHAVFNGYTMSRSFMLAHALGFVGRRTARARGRHCADCEFHRERDGRSYCYGARAGEGCGCPTTWWWFPSRLAWKLRLANYACPVGRFPGADAMSVGCVVVCATALVAGCILRSGAVMFVAAMWWVCDWVAAGAIGDWREIPAPPDEAPEKN